MNTPTYRSVASVPSDGHDEEVAVFRDQLGRFLDDVAPSEQIAQWNADKIVPRDLWRQAGAFGLLGASVPAAYGGLGGDFRHERVIIEEFGRRGLEGWGVPLHNMIVAPYTVALGTDEQKAPWLPGIVSGETSWRSR